MSEKVDREERRECRDRREGKVGAGEVRRVNRVKGFGDGGQEGVAKGVYMEGG